MTDTKARTLIETTYRVHAGRIASPGKFEGEMVYVPYFWDQFLMGMADRDDGDIIGFNIDYADRELFPEIPKRKRTIRLRERSDGFVCEV